MLKLMLKVLASQAEGLWFKSHQRRGDFLHFKKLKNSISLLDLRAAFSANDQFLSAEGSVRSTDDVLSVPRQHLCCSWVVMVTEVRGRQGIVDVSTIYEQALLGILW